MFDKTKIKSIYKISHREKMTDEDFADRGRFIITTMGWNNYETKCWVQDFVPFINRFKPDWKSLYEHHKNNPEEIRRSNPLCPRLPEESESEYDKRCDQFALDHPE